MHPAPPARAAKATASRPTTTRFSALLAVVALFSLKPAPADAQPAAAGPDAGTTASAASCPPLLRHTMTRLQDEAPQPLCQYAGRVLLVVNTASQCGYTPQYEGLERLHAKYAARGLVVMGFPSNDFGGQEPGGAKEIAQTCFNVYGVRFPMFSKVAVKGAGAHPFYAQIARASGQAPGWNFHKYLVDRSGKVVASFKSDVEPEDRRLTAELDKLLAAR